MRDPVTGFEYPDEWARKCHSPEDLGLVREGLAVLTSSGTILRRGYTTGTTAAAACKAAILSLRGEVASVMVTIPCGLTVNIPVTASRGTAECKKYAGDYPGDVTAGIAVMASAQGQDDLLELETGTGIGRFTRDTPRFKKGTPAITPAPLSCILQSMEEALLVTGFSGAHVLLSIPEGVNVAARTLNSRVGIEGGISVLGTTGLVEPWDDHLTDSALDRIARAPRVLLTTGRTGLRFARLRYPGYEAVLVGSKIDSALLAAHGDVILFGLPGLILKYIRPDILKDTGCLTVEELGATPGFPELVSDTILNFRKDHPNVGIVVINRKGDVLGEIL